MGRAFLPGPPQDGLEQSGDLGAGDVLFELAYQQVIYCVGPVPEPAAAGAVVVGVVFELALGGTSGQHFAAGGADQEPPQGQGGFGDHFQAVPVSFPPVQHVLHFVEQVFRDQAFVEPFDETAFLVPVLGDEYLPAVHGVPYGEPEKPLGAPESLFLGPPEYLLGIVQALGQFPEGPLEDSCLGLVGHDALFPRRVGPVDVAHRGQPHVTPLFPCPPHAMDDVQCPPVVFHFRCGQVEGQHHFVFGDGQVQGLLDGLWLHPQFPKGVDHLVGVAGIAAEPVPFQEQDKAGPAPVLS
nr:hypothetical protein [Marinilongibacter aquaticus]